MKIIKGYFWLPSDPIPPHPPHPIKLALHARCVNPELDPGGSGKELVGEGSGTVRARLVWVQFYKKNPFKINFWKSLSFAQKWRGGGGGQFYKRNPFNRNFWKYQNSAQIWQKVQKKGCCLLCFWNTLLFAWFFKNKFSHLSFENVIPTPQLDIKFWNP